MIISNKLPYDTIFEIFSYLEEKDVLKVCQVSKFWTLSIAARSDRIWAKKYENAVRITQIRKNKMKIVKRRKSSYEKYNTLRHQEYLFKIEQETPQSYSGIVVFKGNQGIDNIKCTVEGDRAVGKSWLLIAYLQEDHRFPPEQKDYLPRTSEHTTTINVNGRDVGMCLWDSVSEEDNLRCLSYTQSHVFLLCASVANPVSLQNIERRWAREVKRNCSEAAIILVLTKADLRLDEGVKEELSEMNRDFVKFDDAVKVARKIGASGVYECSAFTGKGVRHVFDQAINIVLFGSKGNNREKCCVM